MLTRNDGRAPEMGRPVTIETDFVRTADGSCLICTGNTKVICTASVEENVPPFLRGKGQGWVTAEYAMLPASTGHRKQRDGVKRDGRGVEISRLIGRSLRQAVDLTALGERTITLDCDVLQADGRNAHRGDYRRNGGACVRGQQAAGRGQAPALTDYASNRGNFRRRGG